MAQKATLPPVVRLEYKKDDLIIKQGDYGISIYTIISGLVGIFIETEEKEIRLAKLGPGEIFGEMIFLDKSTTPRSASARALIDSEVEAWHPARLNKEYSKMPPMLKYISDHSLGRLLLMNRKISALNNKRKKLEEGEFQLSQRKFFRMEVNLDCLYRPVDESETVELWGRIMNISKGGLKMLISFMNTKKFTHKPGGMFVVSTNLTEDRQFMANARIIAVEKTHSPAKLSVRMAFVQLSEEAQKRLGFFLMR